jgi:hypothetical protein
VGLIGDYPSDGAHLHFDCADLPSWWACYRDQSIPWRDPLEILYAHLPRPIVDQMLKDRDA